MTGMRITHSSPCRRKKLKALQVGVGATPEIPWSGNPSFDDMGMMQTLSFPPVPRTASGGTGVLRHTCRKIQGCLRSKCPSMSQLKNSVRICQLRCEPKERSDCLHQDHRHGMGGGCTAGETVYYFLILDDS